MCSIPSESHLCPEAYYGKAQAEAITAVNFARMPWDIRKQLAKLRSKNCGLAAVGKRDTVGVGSTGEAPARTDSHVGIGDDDDRQGTGVPPGYLLVEFFGSHDFGWIKAESMLPFAAVGTKPASGRVGGGNEGMRQAAATECWRLRETFEFLPATTRARIIEALVVDRCALRQRVPLYLRHTPRPCIL